MNTRKNFEDFLQKNNIKYIKNHMIENVPFNACKRHVVDYYLPDFNLNIEMCGRMTIYKTTILSYLLESYPKNFYILQVTEEDWIEPYNQSKHPSKASKLRSNVTEQYAEILALKAGEITAAEL